LVKDENPDFILHAIENALRYQQKSMQRKVIEREIFELVVDNQELIANGYNFAHFKKVLHDKIGDLVDGVIHTTITECAGCRNHLCHNIEVLTSLPQFTPESLMRRAATIRPCLSCSATAITRFSGKRGTYVPEAEQTKRGLCSTFLSLIILLRRSSSFWTKKRWSII
jgi:hypothetical protein